MREPNREGGKQAPMSKQRKSAPASRSSTHDSGYKRLYSHVPMIRDLLQGFVPGDWVHELDLETVENCSGSYVSDDLRDRADDIC